MTEERIKKYRYSEIFGGHGYLDENGKLVPGTIQGEGFYTGIPSLWIRLWGCNKECHGFSQDNPTDPSTYELPFEQINVSKYKTLEDLPVFSKGCDSSYSWSKKFMDLAHKDTAEGIVNKLRQRLVNGKFKHPKTGQECHLVFTGGEPILSQHAVLAVLQEFENQGEIPQYVTIETNGSLPLREDFVNYIKDISSRLVPAPEHDVPGTDVKHSKFAFGELFWSVSPKIFSTSGEKASDSILPDVVKQYYDLSDKGQFKFVCNGSAASWKEIDEAVLFYRTRGIDWPVWIMPVGATIEGQQLVAADVADQAIYRGYNVSARVHTYLYGNVVGR